MTTRKRRVRRRYEPQERNIRKAWNVYNDGSESVAGYHVRVKGEDHGTFPNITQARAERDRAKADDLRGQRVRPGAGKVLLRDVVEEWLQGPQVLGAKPLTRSGYQRIARNRLAPLHGKPVRTIGKADVKTFVGGLVGEGLAPATVGHVLFVLKSVMETAVDSGYIAANPCHGVKKPSMKRKPLTILGHSQVEAIVGATPGPWNLLVLLAANSGLRAGELAGLRVRNLNPLKGSVTVEETVYGNMKQEDAVGTPKSASAYRTVDELPRDLVDRLAALVEGWPPDAYLFGGNGRPYDSEDFAFAPSAKPYAHARFYRQVFLPTVRGLGIPVRFHDLRHYHASAVLEAGLSVPYVAKRLGHANAQMILTVYGHVLEGHGVGLADRLAAQRAASQVRRIG